MDAVQKVAWGLLAAWIVHDLEELATMPGWSQRAAADLPAPIGKILPMSRAEAATAVGLTGVAMAAASAAGAATGGRSKFFQASLTGFGLHAGTHLAQSALHRGYTPGLVTTPLVVIPYSLWAWRRLRLSGVPQAPSDVRLNLALAAVVPLSHLVARLPRLLRRKVVHRR
ncbi:uncharacterized protein with HXXEE motif [Kribbella amoyensis]|uniref:Uncharacterized protein with HXXEE motif n=1 Tax=Kribbella amoyensis TaxID=996641 RepID=A0A561BV75_9ACTN|nr:HXXEE domain-containing protein [Kribbella amoyensis]TWD82805.1 uncharacterized protein with HXXEE motif [Kribbella amoyensis]